MQQDDVIWQVIGTDFCSFKVKTTEKQQTFCRNEYNLTGLCDRRSCPLANSQYATVREIQGSCYLFVKTIERAHMPALLWEKIKLDQINTEKAIEQIQQELVYWPSFIIEMCKKRYQRIKQVQKRQRKLITSSNEHTELEPYKKKQERRERGRELKAETRAKIDSTVEKELLDRLHSGVYGDIYNFPTEDFDTTLDDIEDQQDSISEDIEDEMMFIEADDDEEPYNHLEIEYEESVNESIETISTSRKSKYKH